MFRLLKLLAYGLLGYAIYEFVRGAMGNEIAGAVNRMSDRMSDAMSGGGEGGQGGGGGQGIGGMPHNLRQDAPRANMTGPGQGAIEATQETDGGSVTHAVGRGVVS